MRFFLTLVLIAVVTPCLSEEHQGGKKLIEWGWDEPGTKFIRENIQKMEEYPFDGLIFHVVSSKGGKGVFLHGHDRRGHDTTAGVYVDEAHEKKSQGRSIGPNQRKIAMLQTLTTLQIAFFILVGDTQVHRDLAYVQPKNERQTLDVYAPTEGRGHPVVFWIHGGGWQQGDKTSVQAKPQAFVDKGFVFVSTNYRFVPNVTIEKMAGDVAKAIRWTHDHAKEYGGDPETFFVMGHSAGAQLAALVCTDDRYLETEGLSLSIIKGCVPVDGDTYDVPMQIATVEQRRKDIYTWKFGDKGHQKDLSPVTHVAKGKHIPPFVILHVADHPETKAQSKRLAKALQEAGVSAKAFPAKGKNHTSINADLGLPDDLPTKAMFEFVDGVLKK